MAKMMTTATLAMAMPVCAHKDGPRWLVRLAANCTRSAAQVRRLPIMAPTVSTTADGAAGVTVATVTTEIVDEGVSPRAVSAVPNVPALTAVENVVWSPLSAAAAASTRNVIARTGSGVSARMRIRPRATFSMMMLVGCTLSVAAMAFCSDDMKPASVAEAEVTPLKDEVNVTRTNEVAHAGQARLSVS